MAWEYTSDFTALLKIGAYSKAEKCVKYFVLKRVPRAETSKTDTYKRHLKGSHTRMIMASVRYCVSQLVNNNYAQLWVQNFSFLLIWIQNSGFFTQKEIRFVCIRLKRMDKKDTVEKKLKDLNWVNNNYIYIN